MFCVEISSPEHFEAYDQSPIPWDHIMAYVRDTVNPQMEEVYSKHHDNGVSIMIAIAPTADKVRDGDKPAAYLRELVAMPDIIETDYPQSLSISRSRAEALSRFAIQDRTNPLLRKLIRQL